MKLFRFPIPKSILWQEQAFEDAQEVQHEEIFPERELTPFQVKKVNQMQAWATRQRNRIYDELHEAVKEARQ